MQGSWQRWQCFWVVAEQGSFSKAAEHLQLSQATLSRQVAALEQELKVDLLLRTSSGVRLTEPGRALLAQVQHMASAAQQAQRLAEGAQAGLKGAVRLSVNEVVGHYLLPEALTAFRRAYPQIELELVISNQASNLHKRDADMAFRMFAPNQSQLVQKRLPDMALAMVAHRDYLAAQPSVQQVADLSGHTLIGFDQGTQLIDSARQQGWQLSAADFSWRTDSLLLQIQLIEQAQGIGISHLGLLSCYPNWQRLLPSMPIPPMPCYLVCHQDLYTNPRMRALMDFLSQWFAKGYSYER